MRVPLPLLPILLTLGVWVPASLNAQIVLSPTHLRPAAWERIDLRVVNQVQDPIVEVTLTVPEVIAILGVDAPEDWTFWLERATDSTPQVIGFTGGGITTWELEEFSFLGRLEGDTRKENLVFPARVTRASGAITDWARIDGAEGAPPVIIVQGTTEITGWGTLAAAAGAFGLSVLALGFSLSGRQPTKG